MLRQKKQKKNGVDIASFGAGLLITVVVYTCGSLVAHIPGLSKIHMLAWTIIIACILKLTSILPKNVETSVNNYFNYMMKNLLCVVAGGIGIASFDITSAAAALANPANIFIVIVGVLAATISAMIIGRMLGLYPIETGISVGLCSCNIGGSGDLAVLMAANRMNLLPFASISTRIGGALMLVWISLLMPMFVK